MHIKKINRSRITSAEHDAASYNYTIHNILILINCFAVEMSKGPSNMDSRTDGRSFVLTV